MNRIESLREITNMQVGQCGNQEAHAEFLNRRRRAVRVIAVKANSPQYRLSR